MADVITIQDLVDGRLDVKGMATFYNGPAGQKVPRRLAGDIETLEFYLEYMRGLQAVYEQPSGIVEVNGVQVKPVKVALDDALNAAVVGGGGLADTAVAVTAQLPNSITRSLSAVNAESVSINTFGDCGNGAEDTAVFNLAVTTLSDLAKADGKPRALRLIAGKVYYLKNAKIKPLVDLVCVDGIATLKRVNVPVGTPESTSSYWRILEPSRYSWDSDACYRHRSNVKNIVFDGNYDNAEWTRGSYNQEQAASFIIYGENNADINKRVKFNLDNVYFKDSVADGFHVHINADVTVNNGFAENCFRGGLVVTGGNTVIRVNNWVSENARLDMEIDGAGSNGSMTTKIYIKNYTQDLNNQTTPEFVGGADIGGIGEGGLLNIDNMQVYSSPFNWFMGSVPNQRVIDYSIRNSLFTVKNNNVYNPFLGLIENVTFRIDNTDEDAVGGLKFLMSFDNYTQNNATDLVFKNTKFTVIDSATSKKPTLPLIKILSQLSANKSRLRFEGFDSKTVDMDSYVFECGAGGKIYLDKISIASTKFITGSGVTESGAYILDVTIGSVESTKGLDSFSSFFTAAVGDANYNAGFDNRITFLPSCEIRSDSNIFEWAFPYTGQFNKKTGFRTIIGDTAPLEGVPSYKGDIYTLKTKVIGKPYEWVSTKHALGTPDIYNEWRATKWLTGSFTTANLPALTAFDVGTQNIDTTLNKIVTWTGTAWI